MSTPGGLKQHELKQYETCKQNLAQAADTLEKLLQGGEPVDKEKIENAIKTLESLPEMVGNKDQVYLQYIAEVEGMLEEIIKLANSLAGGAAKAAKAAAAEAEKRAEALEKALSGRYKKLLPEVEPTRTRLGALMCCFRPW